MFILSCASVLLCVLLSSCSVLSICGGCVFSSGLIGVCCMCSCTMLVCIVLQCFLMFSAVLYMGCASGVMFLLNMVCFLFLCGGCCCVSLLSGCDWCSAFCLSSVEWSLK